MLTKSDVNFSIEETTTNVLCWLCVKPIVPTITKQHYKLELNGHMHSYRTHIRCFYELFGNFCMVAYATNMVLETKPTLSVAA